VKLRDRLGVSRRTQVRLVRLMELSLVGLLFVGLERRNVGVVVNTAVALGVTQVPPLLERDYGVPMDPALVLWVTGAAFLHALGTVGIPGTGGTFYTDLWWWDHLTHSLSASVVAAAGYATVRAVEEHSEAVDFPGRFVFVFVLLFVMAFGVAWEVLEFGLGAVAGATGVSVLTQYGLEDTMLDLTFDLVGGLVAATWGTAYLTDVTGALADRLRRDGTGPAD
jgi:hypothetical protein